jgi:hypothetical protein
MADEIIRKAYPAKTGEQKDRGRFKPGQSGNPKGRPQGSRHKATLAALAALEGDLGAVTAKLVEKAKAGESWAVKLVMDKLVPNARDTPVRFKLEGGLTGAMESILQDTANGHLTPGEALTISQVITALGLAQQVEEIEKKLNDLQPAPFTGRINRG